MDKFKNWMIDTASIMFKEDGNPFWEPAKKHKVKYSSSIIICMVCNIWYLCFSIRNNGFRIWVSNVAHVLLIFGVYYTFKQFHRGKKMINRFNPRPKLQNILPLN